LVTSRPLGLPRSVRAASPEAHRELVEDGGDRDGRIYLSDTVQVGLVYQRLAGGWRTPGWYRMMRERFLAEMLPASAQPLHGGQWPYVVAAPSLDAPGLLYNVHAVVMTRRGG